MAPDAGLPWHTGYATFHIAAATAYETHLQANAENFVLVMGYFLKLSQPAVKLLH